MKIEKLILENFSSYYGKHEFAFNTTPEKPVTVIIGKSGAGKTSIFDAINWALYGKSYEPDLKERDQIEIQQYVNETAMSEAKENGHGVEMACTLFFEYEGRHYRIQQAIMVTPNKDGSEITDRTTSLYEHSRSGNLTQIGQIEAFLNEILPGNVRDYFFFNGDRIEKLALKGSSTQIRDGIYRVVDLELLQNGMNHLEDVAKRFRKKAKAASSGEMKDIETRYEKEHDDLSLLKEKLANIDREQIALEDQINKIDNKLKDSEETIELQKQREIRKNQLTQQENQLEEITSKIREETAKGGLIFAFREIQELKDVLEAKREKGEIPSSISESLLMDILELQKCICETRFSEGDEVYTALKKRLEREREKSNTGQDLLDLFFELRSVETTIYHSLKNIRQLDKKRGDIDLAIREIGKELNEIMEQLKGIPDENISTLTAMFTEYIDQRASNKVEIATLKDRIKVKEASIEELRQERKVLGQKKLKVRKFQLRDELAQNAAKELERIFETFAEDSRREVETFTREEFYKFISTAKSLDIGISDEFHYDVRDRSGNPALHQLSNGQKQALSLAYITSISRVSEKYPPLVIDMPLGRLDGDVQDMIAERLPELATQVILLMLPTSEWNDNTKKRLRPKASDIYYLEFDSELRQTTTIRR